MRLGIRPKLVVLSLCILVAVSAGFTALDLLTSRTWVEEDLRDRAIAFAREVAATISDERELRNSALLQPQVDQILAVRRNVAQLDVFALELDSTQLIATSHPATRLPFVRRDALRVREGRIVSRLVVEGTDRYWEVMAPVTLGTRVVGAVAAKFSLARADALEQRTRRWALGVTVASLVVMGLLMTLAVHVVVNRPVGRLMAAIARAREGHGAAPVGVRSSDEFGTLARHFDDLVARLQEFNDELQRRVKEATAELEQRNEALFRTQRALAHTERLALAGRLMAQVAHEVGTPLHSIAGHLELLRGDLAAPDAPGGARRRLAIVEAEVARLAGIIAQLLDLTRRTPAAPQRVDLCALLQHTADLVRPGLASAGVTLRVRTPRTPVDVTGHRDQLQQVILNLLTNAIDATPGGGSIDAETARQLTGEAALEIVDDGPGVPADARERIFEPFFSTKGPRRGTGLGLFVSRQVVREHGGRLEVDGATGRGARFRVVLPGIPDAS